MILVTIAPGHWLAPGPAAAYLAMIGDRCPAGITDAGRTNAEQVTLFTDRYTTNWFASAKSDKRVWAGNVWWRKPGVDSAATPGTSNHETGFALDLPAAPAAWVRVYGAAYGWVADRVKGEWWHFEFEAGRATHPTPTPLTPPTRLQEDDMLPLILWCYAELVGRPAPPSTDEVANWISGTPGWTSAQVLAAFFASGAEQGSVVTGYWDILGRAPESQAVIDAHLAAKPTIRQLRINLAASTERQAR